ncbi:MAG: holo-ACP synthase [Thermodesulfovibrionales bacterium]
MIYGLGIDIVSVKRLKEVVDRWDRRFLDRVFTLAEIDYCLARKDSSLPLSARFAAKEAMIKALGSRTDITFKDIEVINTGDGMPIINPGIRLKERLDRIGIKNIHLSLSHEKDYSVACVILER